MKPIRYASQLMEENIAKAPIYEASVGEGLTGEQVNSRRKAFLTNRIKKQVTKSYFRIFFDNLFSFFNIILFAIATLMFVAGIDSLSSYLFVVILAANIVIGLVSDIRARVLVDRLRLLTDPKAKVIRDGKKEEIAIEDVVLSDIVYLDTGDQVPCDCLLLDGNLSADESLLTGEAEPVNKRRGDTLLGASFVKSGHGYCRAVKVGAASYSETLRTSAQTFGRPRSEIKRSTLSIFLVTGIASILVGLATFLTYYVPIWCGRAAEYSFREFVLQLSGKMVAMIPSGLYLLTSLTLAVGVIAMARKRMNVQELYCIEMLARVDTVCFDKTGTLTDGTLSLHGIDLLGDVSEQEARRLAYSIVKATGDRNSTAEALLDAGEGTEAYGSTLNVPFDSSRKYSAATLKGKGTYAVGAFGFVKSRDSAELSSRIESLSQKGYRVLVLYRVKKGIEDGAIEGMSEPLAVFSFVDTIKPDAAANIKWFVDSGVDIKVISGDDALTVGRIAELVGVPNAGRAISMNGVPLERIPDLADRYTVFGRVSPEQKAALVEALQKKGHKVAMTGDGVNDILALKKADCSIAMASGSAAARNISHLVALDNDFSHLPEVVGEGRRVINNLQRTASLFLSKTIFAGVLSVVFLISDWCGGVSYPFTTQNMLLWEVLSIGVPAFFLSLQPTRERLHGSFLKNILFKAIPAGTMESLVVLVIYLSFLISPGFMSEETAVTMSVFAFSALSFVTLFRVSLPPSRYRLAVFGSMLSLAVLVVFLDVALAKGIIPLDIGGLLGIDYAATYFGPGPLSLCIAAFAVGAALFVAIESYLVRRSRRREAEK